MKYNKKTIKFFMVIEEKYTFEKLLHVLIGYLHILFADEYN